jgi:hypothetical protein
MIRSLPLSVLTLQLTGLPTVETYAIIDRARRAL